MKGAKIVVPAGTYYIKGPIVLASNVCIELQKGATLKFAPEEKYYPVVSITNSPFWCVHLLKSENIICRNLRYDAKLMNNDGIDPECSRNVLIEGVEFNKCNNVKQAALVLQGTEAKPVFNVLFNNVDVAKAKIGLSFENALDVTMGSSHIGGKVGTPTTVTPHDNLFGKEK